MISISYNNEYIKVYKNGHIIWFKSFGDFDQLMKALEQIKAALR